MKYRLRICYTEEQKALMWDRWQKGESLGSIARLFDRGSAVGNKPTLGSNPLNVSFLQSERFLDLEIGPGYTHGRHSSNADEPSLSTQHERKSSYLT